MSSGPRIARGRTRAAPQTALVLNKKRLEALLLKAAEALPPSADEPSSSGVRGGGGGSLRTQIQKVRGPRNLWPLGQGRTPWGYEALECGAGTLLVWWWRSRHATIGMTRAAVPRVGTTNFQMGASTRSAYRWGLCEAAWATTHTALTHALTHTHTATGSG